jgi:hypothetical protein
MGFGPFEITPEQVNRIRSEMGLGPREDAENVPNVWDIAITPEMEADLERVLEAERQAEEERIEREFREQIERDRAAHLAAGHAEEIEWTDEDEAAMDRAMDKIRAEDAANGLTLDDIELRSLTDLVECGCPGALEALREHMRERAERARQMRQSPANDA